MVTASDIIRGLVIHTYVTGRGYVYLHIPQRLVAKYGITSGHPCLISDTSGKLCIEIIPKQET